MLQRIAEAWRQDPQKIGQYGERIIGALREASTGSEAGEGLILDEQVIVEIVNPGTGNPVERGAVGEVLVTVLTPEYPLIRFSTGDLSAYLDGPSPCGRTNQRIKGWLG